MGTRRTHFFSAQRRLSTGVLGVLTALALLLGLLAATTSQAAVLATAAPTRVDLKLLVLDDGSSSMLSIKAELDRQGIPYTDLALGTWDGITTTNFLSQTITTADVPAQSIIEGHYQGVVLPDRQFVSTAAIAALDAYELQFGVRELATYAWPSGGSYGLASTGGVLDGLTTTLTAAAKAPATLNVPAGPFAYLNGSPTFDNNDPAPAAQEVFGYSVTTGASATWTPLVNVTAGGGVPSGAVVGVQTDGSGRQHMLITADSNTGQVWMDILSRGAVSWVTRGVALAYERNYLSMQIDDLFLADDRWNYSQKCTYTGASGSACLLPPSGGATIQMTSADVNYLLSTWQSPVAHAKIKLGFAFNASGAASSTSLVNTFTSPTNLPLFYFVNHTWDHEYLGCLQNAPSETIAWLCYNSSNPPGTVVNPANGPYDLNTADYSWYPELGDSTYTGIIPEITLNKDWAATHLGASWNPNELVTGEHSGLAMTPQQGPDNPALADALTQTQITAIASDASRETGQRTIGSASTVPRHPMDIYYNTSTYQEAVSEYSTIYPGLGLTALTTRTTRPHRPGSTASSFQPFPGSRSVRSTQTIPVPSTPISPTSRVTGCFSQSSTACSTSTPRYS